MKRIIVYILTVITLFNVFLLCGCKEKTLPYNAKIRASIYTREKVLDWPFKEWFWEENLVMAMYLNDEYNKDDPNSKEYIMDKTSPQNRLHIVDTQERFEEIFLEQYQNDYQVNFEEKMMIIYFFASPYSGKYEFKDLGYENKTLKIFARKVGTNHVYTEYARRVIVLFIDKLDVGNIYFSSANR